MMAFRLPIIAFVVLASTANAQDMSGIYGCSGYFSGLPTNYQNIPIKMSLTIKSDSVFLTGDYNFFGTNIKNPIYGSTYVNCGMLFPPEFNFKAETCDYFDADGGMIMRDFGTLDASTMRMTVFNIASDGSATFDCVKTEY